MSIHNPIPKFIRYRVDAGSQVKVAIKIGDAQSGGWAFGFGAGGVTKGVDEAPAPVGTGSELKGRLFQVAVTVVDVRPETNRLSAVVTVSGGPDGDAKVTQSFDDGGDGDSALLTTLVAFE